MHKKWTVAILGLSALFLSSAAVKADVDVKFAPGKTHKTVKGKIKGDKIVNYIVDISGRNQMLTVHMSTSNASAYFNVFPPRGNKALFIGSTSGTDYEQRVNHPGKYRVQVYLMRNAARRNETARYRINIGVTGGYQEADKPQPPQIIMGKNGEGEVIFKGNNCVVYFRKNGRIREASRLCRPRQTIRAAVEMVKYRKEQGLGFRDSAAQKEHIADIKGMNGIKAFDMMMARGFKNVDSFSSGRTLYGVYYNPKTLQCVQTTSAKNRIVDIRDIHTHPNCH